MIDYFTTIDFSFYAKSGAKIQQKLHICKFFVKLFAHVKKKHYFCMTFCHAYYDAGGIFNH